MNTESDRSTGTGRRTWLRRGLAFFGGLAAAGTTGALAKRAVAEPAPNATSTIYGRKRPFAGDTGARVVGFAELYDTPGGRKIGEIHTNSFCLSTPHGLDARADSNIEFQVVQLEDGSLFGMRGGSHTDVDAIPTAIVGGTARYAGASGTLVERPMGGGTPGHDHVEFVLTLSAQRG
jgi:hypothetical protein